MLEECCGGGYSWSIPYGSLNYCFLTQGTTVCSHMTAISQWRVLAVRTPAQVCSLNVGTVLHWRDPVLSLFSLLWERTGEPTIHLSIVFHVNVQRGNRTEEHYYQIDICAYYTYIYIHIFPNLQYAAHCYVQHINSLIICLNFAACGLENVSVLHCTSSAHLANLLFQ